MSFDLNGVPAPCERTKGDQFLEGVKAFMESTSADFGVCSTDFTDPAFHLPRCPSIQSRRPRSVS